MKIHNFTGKISEDNDLDILITLRSSKLSSTELLSLSQEIISFLTSECSHKASLYERELRITESIDKKLSVILCKLQSN